MASTVFTVVDGALLLVFGILVTAAFSGIKASRRSSLLLLLLTFICGIAQTVVFFAGSVDLLEKLYPLVTHLPILLYLIFVFGCRPITVISSVFTAYMCCQPAKWFGVLAYAVSGSEAAFYFTRFTVLAVTAVLMMLFFASTVHEIFSKKISSVCIFATVPTVYYVFDYLTAVYTDTMSANSPIAVEFLPFLLCIAFFVFCLIYYREYELKADAQRREQVIRITVEQQAKELEARKRGEQEIRVLRHDLRLFLSTLAFCVETDEKSTAIDMITSYSSRIEGTKAKRFCGSDTVNYVISDFATRFEQSDVNFICNAELDKLATDEIMFATILSNALENALHATEELPIARREIRLLLKFTDGKLLMSVKNTFKNPPVFSSEGHPIATKEGHGYGTQSIRYLTEKLGGNCQFTVKDNVFITRVII